MQSTIRQIPAFDTSVLTPGRAVYIYPSHEPGEGQQERAQQDSANIAGLVTHCDERTLTVAYVSTDEDMQNVIRHKSLSIDEVSRGDTVVILMKKY